MTSDEMIFELLKQNLIRADLDTGNVFSNKRKSPRKNLSLGSPNQDGYMAATLWLGKLKKKINIHRIILTAKLGCILPVGSIADHIDRVRTNNKASNLRLVSVQENTDNSRRLKGGDSPHSKIDRATADAIRLDYATSKSYIKTAEKFGLNFSHVGNIVRNEVWTDDVITTKAEFALKRKLAREARYQKAEGIRAYHKMSNLSHREIAEIFAMSKATIRFILKGGGWNRPLNSPLLPSPKSITST